MQVMPTYGREKSIHLWIALAAFAALSGCMYVSIVYKIINHDSLTLMDLKEVLPHVLAAINVATIAALTSGYVAIRNGRRRAHRKCMLVAVALGAVFMVFYLAYHFGVGLAKFGGYGIIRPIYFSILIMHIVAATVAAPLVPVAVFRALSGQLEAHRRLAFWAWRIWMFVAVSGVVVYVMTIHVWPDKAIAP